MIHYLYRSLYYVTISTCRDHYKRKYECSMCISRNEKEEKRKEKTKLLQDFSNAPTSHRINEFLLMSYNRLKQIEND